MTSFRQQIGLLFPSLCTYVAAKPGWSMSLGRRARHPGFEFIPRGTYAIGQGQKCAAELRRHLELNDSEVIRDLFGLMRSMGFKVFRRRSRTRTSLGSSCAIPTRGLASL